MMFRDDPIGHVLETLFRILRACGASRESISQAVNRALDACDSVEPIQTLAAPPGQHIACTDVVFGWRRMNEFLDANGNPRALPVSGVGPTFERLCQLVAPSYRVNVLLEYLDSLGAIQRSEDNTLVLATDSVLTCRFDKGGTVAPQTVLPHLMGFLGAVEHNVTRTTGKRLGRFERACYSAVPRSLVPVFERFVEVRGQNFVDTIDEWLVRHRATGTSRDDSCFVGAGAYVVVHNSNIFEVEGAEEEETSIS
jgi:hypothetical protein